MTIIIQNSYSDPVIHKNVRDRDQIDENQPTTYGNLKKLIFFKEDNHFWNIQILGIKIHRI